MIVRWGLDELPGVLDELSVHDPLLISTERWPTLEIRVADRLDSDDLLGRGVDPGLRDA